MCSYLIQPSAHTTTDFTYKTELILAMYYVSHCHKVLYLINRA